MRAMAVLTLALLGATVMAACASAEAKEAQRIEDEYGLTGAYANTVLTADGPVKGTLVPITLANGKQGHLFIPQSQLNEPRSVYVQDERGLHPIVLRDNVTRDELARSTNVVEPQQEVVRPKKRSWEKEALIIGGSAGGGAAIGAVAGGKKGAKVGAVTGGVGGLIYDLLTRNKK